MVGAPLGEGEPEVIGEGEGEGEGETDVEGTGDGETEGVLPHAIQYTPTPFSGTELVQDAICVELSKHKVLACILEQSPQERVPDALVSRFALKRP